MGYIIITLILTIVARCMWAYMDNTRGKVKLIKIENKTYLCKEFKGFFGRYILWLNPHKSLYSSIGSTLEYQDDIFDVFDKQHYLEQTINSSYTSDYVVDLNDPLPVRVGKYWSGVYEDEQNAKEKVELIKSNALQKELLSKVNTAEVIWESEPKPTKTSKTTDILQAAYSDEVLRLTPLIIEAHTNGDSIKENQHLDELEKLMILHGKLKN